MAHSHCNNCSAEHHHEHEHEHHHEHSLKQQLWLIGITVVLLIIAVLIEKFQFSIFNSQLTTWQLLLVYLVPYLIIGHDTLKEAAEGVLHGDAFNEHFLMSVATIGALCIGFLPGAETEFPEAVFVMLFFQVGELFEGYAEGKSRDSIAHLMDIRPDVAHVEKSQRDVAPDEVAVGDVIIIKPGEKVPLDGVIIEGASALNTVALTGESLPREVGEGDEVISGCVNLSGVIRVRTTKPFGESTVSKIIRLVEHAGENKSQSEAFITRFARIYTPVVVFLAIAIAVIPTLMGGSFATWLYRALMFLVVSCPCALVISVPLTFFGGIGGASRKGILVKGANYMDVLAKVDSVVFDKTGTLTHGQFAVTAIHPDICNEHELLHLAAHVEHYTTHPIGAALRDAFPDEATDGCEVSDVEEIAGHGIRARVGDKIVCVGNTKMMDSVGAKWHDCHHIGTIIHVAIDGVYAGHIVINDKIKDDSAEAIASLKELGVTRTVMLTGDRQEVAKHVAETLGLSEYHAELLPVDKVAQVERLLGEKGQGGYLAFVGDGINDAPVLARADIGIAMGGLGSDAAIEAADVVLMDDKPSKIALAIRIARRTLAIARQNVWFAIGVKVAVLILAAFGIATMWLAVFADVGVTVLAVLNAMRALRIQMNALSVITNKQKRKTWLRAFRIWQRRPYELAPLTEAMHTCASCGTEYQGNYCPRCGQSAKIGRFSFKKAILHFLDVWGIGNRGMFRSIRDLIFRPGYMIRDYLRGMQSAYFPPFKMFFLLAALSFVVEHGVTLVPEENDENQKTEQKTAQATEEAIATKVNNIEKKQTGRHLERSEGSFKFEYEDQDHDLSEFQVRFLKAGLRVVKFLNGLRKQNSSLFALFSLLFFATPLYLFFRRSPTIPDLRFSEFIVALVYTSNMYSIYSILASVFGLHLLTLLAAWMVLVTLKQLTGYSKWRMFFYAVVSFLLSIITLILLINLAILIVSYFTAPVA